MTEAAPYCRCLFYSANALARITTRLAEEAFSAVGLAPSYAFVLMTVNRIPGIQSGELARIMMLTPSTVTRLVEKLEERKLVRRHTEGRTTLVYPTPDSVALDEAIKTAWSGLYRKYIEILGEDAARQVTGDVYKAALELDKT